MSERPLPVPDTESHDDRHDAIERYADLGLGTVADGQLAYGLRRSDGPARRPSRAESMKAHPTAHRRSQEPKYEPRDPNYDVRSAGLSDEQRHTNEIGIQAVRQILNPPTTDPLELARRKAREERKKRP